MASYPKRLDLWNVYLDKEIKGGDIRAARNLLERLVSGRASSVASKSGLQPVCVPEDWIMHTGSECCALQAWESGALDQVLILL